MIFRGFRIYGVKRGYDYVHQGMSQYQTVLTAVVANSEQFDSLDTVVQSPIAGEMRSHSPPHVKSVEKMAPESVKAAA